MVWRSLWVESCRRDLLDHIIAVNERHLKRLLSEYVRYYHEDRTHLGLGSREPARMLTRTGAAPRRLRSYLWSHHWFPGFSRKRLAGLESFTRLISRPQS